MGEDRGQVGAPVGTGQKDPDQIRREIEVTREQLGETAAALAAKTDVKARAQEKADEVKTTARSNPAPFIAAGVGAVLVIWMLSRRGN